MAEIKSIAECWPSLEVVVKASQYRGYLLLEFLKRFYEGRSIIERYDCGVSPCTPTVRSGMSGIAKVFTVAIALGVRVQGQL